MITLKPLLPFCRTQQTLVCLVACCTALALGGGCVARKIGTPNCDPDAADSCPSGFECVYVPGEQDHRCLALSGIDLQLVTSPPAQAATCPADGVGALDTTVVNTVRVTFFNADSGPRSMDSFLCDYLVRSDESGIAIAVPTPADSNLHISVEAFAQPAAPGDAPPLVASGKVDDVPSDGGADIPLVFMALANRMGCSLDSLSKARAFHTVTSLPGGYALIAGGVVATVNSDVTTVAEGSGLMITDELEIYSTQTGRFVRPDLSGEEGIPRAFHTAFLVPGSDENQAQVLLLGGVGQGDVPFGEGVVKIRTGPQHPLRLSPDPLATPAAPMLLTIDLTVDPPVVTRSSNSLAGWPAAFFQAGGYFAETGACVLGGLNEMAEYGDLEPLTDVDLSYPDSEQHYALTGSMSIPRLGHTVSLFSDGSSGLIWGGNLSQVDPAVSVAEWLTIQPTPPQTSILSMDAQSSTAAIPIPTAFHTATLLPGDDVLVTGGFMVQSGLALNPNADASIVRIRRNGNQFEYYPQNAGAFTPVGYHAAVGLPDGTVLITGGSPLFEPGYSPCPSGEFAWTCSVAQAWIYTPGPVPSNSGSLTSLAVGELQVPRLGHTMTLLGNATVLTVGGLRRDGSTLYTEPSAEVFNPATGAVSEDAPLSRSPGATFSEQTVCPDVVDGPPPGHQQTIVRFIREN